MTVHEYIDVAWFVISIIGIIAAKLWPSLDAEARKWLKALGGEAAVKKFLLEAAEMCGNGESNAVKRQFVINEMKAAAKKNGLDLKDSTANLLLEWTFNRAKKTLPKCP